MENCRSGSFLGPFETLRVFLSGHSDDSTPRTRFAESLAEFGVTAAELDCYIDVASSTAVHDPDDVWLQCGFTAERLTQLRQLISDSNHSSAETFFGQ